LILITDKRQNLLLVQTKSIFSPTLGQSISKKRLCCLRRNPSKSASLALREFKFSFGKSSKKSCEIILSWRNFKQIAIEIFHNCTFTKLELYIFQDSLMYRSILSAELKLGFLFKTVEKAFYDVFFWESCKYL